MSHRFVASLIAGIIGMTLPSRTHAQNDMPPKVKVVLLAGKNVSLARISRPEAALQVAAGSRKPSANIEVSYHGFPDEAKAAFEEAVKIWESVLSSSEPIRVNANWVPLGPGVLGQANPTTFSRNFANAPKQNTWYPIALANKLAHRDLEQSAFDIDAEFSSNFPWYFGLDRNTPPGKYDFVSVVLHEVGHGLGFVGSMRLSGDEEARHSYGGAPFVYDYFIVNGLQKGLIDTANFPNPSKALKDQLMGGDLFFDGRVASAAAVGIAPKIYAPEEFQPTSSFSHLDEDSFPPGDLNSLMTPQLDFGEAIHNPGPIGLGILRDLGW